MVATSVSILFVIKTTMFVLLPMICADWVCHYHEPWLCQSELERYGLSNDDMELQPKNKTSYDLIDTNDLIIL